MKYSTDPVEILDAINRQNCNAMHMISGLMQQVHEMKTKHCYDEYNCPNGELTSARSPEILDEIMGKLIYMFSCEANCGVGRVIKTKEHEVKAKICEFDEDNQPKT